MKLHFERTYFTRGLVGELYHQKKLVAYCLEMSRANSHTMLHNLPDGNYYLRSPANGSPGISLNLTLPYTRQRITLCLYDVVTRPLVDCKEPLCFTGDGKLYLSEPARKSLKALFNDAISQQEKIILAVKTIEYSDPDAMPKTKHTLYQKRAV